MWYTAYVLLLVLLVRCFHCPARTLSAALLVCTLLQFRSFLCAPQTLIVLQCSRLHHILCVIVCIAQWCIWSPAGCCVQGQPAVPTAGLQDRGGCGQRGWRLLCHRGGDAQQTQQQCCRTDACAAVQAFLLGFTGCMAGPFAGTMHGTTCLVVLDVPACDCSHIRYLTCMIICTNAIVCPAGAGTIRSHNHRVAVPRAGWLLPQPHPQPGAPLCHGCWRGCCACCGR